MVDQQALSATLDEFAQTVTGDFSLADILELLAEAAVRVLPIDGAGVMVADDDDELLRFAFAAGPGTGRIGDLEQLQAAQQRGPCHDSHVSGQIVSTPDLSLVGDWPDYQVRATELGLASVTALPLQARVTAGACSTSTAATPAR